MPFTSGPVLMYVGAGQYRTVGQTDYVGSEQVFHIPDGFPTDLASVPRLFWALIPPVGGYESSAVLHDWNCTRLAAGDCLISSRDVDGLFRRTMREAGVGFPTRWAMWAGVRWGALFNPARRPGIARDFPLVAVITALELAVVVGVFAAVHLAIDAITGS